MKVETTKSGNPYHDEDGQFTEKENANGSKKSEDKNKRDYKESNLSQEAIKFLERLQKKHNINITELEKKHGNYDPHKGVFADETLPQNDMESLALNYKYWEMLSEEDKQKEHDFFRSIKDKKDLFLEELIENKLLEEKDKIFGIMRKMFPADDKIEFIDFYKNENEYIDSKNKIDFYFRFKQNGKIYNWGVDLKHKSASMGSSISDTLIDFPIMLKNKDNKYVDASYNSPYALNKINLITLIKTGLTKKDFIAKYNPNNPIELEIAAIRNSMVKIFFSKALGEQNYNKNVLYQKLREESIPLVNMYNNKENLIRDLGFVVYDNKKGIRVIKGNISKEDQLIIQVKKNGKGEISTTIPITYKRLKELGFLYDNKNLEDNEDGRKRNKENK